MNLFESFTVNNMVQFSQMQDLVVNKLFALLDGTGWLSEEILKTISGLIHQALCLKKDISRLTPTSLSPTFHR